MYGEYQKYGNCRKNKALVSKGRKQGVYGYMTLEAVLLMPMLAAAIVFTIYMGFYVYNVCLAHQNAYLAALRGSLIEEASLGEVETYTLSELEELTKERWLSAEHVTKEVSVSLSRVTVSVAVVMRMPFSGWLSEELRLWKIEGTATAARIYPVTILRGIRKLTTGDTGG